MVNISELFNLFLKGGPSIPKDTSLWPEEWHTVSHKEYERVLISHSLNDNDIQKNEYPLLQALKRRHSGENFTNKISLISLLQLLSYATSEKEGSASRSYPSAGGLYPLELYFLKNKSGPSDDTFPEGLYHYSQVKKTLSLIKRKKSISLSSELGSPQDWLDDAGGILILTYIPKRHLSKYESFAPRAALLEAGSLLQTVSLTSVALGIKTRIIGYFDNTKIESLLEIDGVNELALCALAISEE